MKNTLFTIQNLPTERKAIIRLRRNMNWDSDRDAKRELIKRLNQVRKSWDDQNQH